MRVHGAQELAGTTDLLRLVGACRIPGELYDLGEYPGLTPGEGTVTGELYEVIDPQGLRLLDEYEAYYEHDAVRSLFVRRQVRLIEPELECWVYLYNQPVDGKSRIPAGNWTEHLRREGRPFR